MSVAADRGGDGLTAPSALPWGRHRRRPAPGPERGGANGDAVLGEHRAQSVVVVPVARLANGETSSGLRASYCTVCWMNWGASSPRLDAAVISKQDTVDDQGPRPSRPAERARIASRSTGPAPSDPRPHGAIVPRLALVRTSGTRAGRPPRSPSSSQGGNRLRTPDSDTVSRSEVRTRSLSPLGECRVRGALRGDRSALSKRDPHPHPLLRGRGS